MVAPSSASNTDPGTTVSFGVLSLSLDAQRVWVSGQEVTLTPLEFRLLSTLLLRRGDVQTRRRLLADVWDMHAQIRTRTVDTHVRRLRVKLCEAAEYVETLHGVGYRVRATPTS